MARVEQLAAVTFAIALAMVAYAALLATRGTGPLRRRNAELVIANARVRAEVLLALSDAGEGFALKAREAEQGYAAAVRAFVEAQAAA